jgi:hypothetical protein
MSVQRIIKELRAQLPDDSVLAKAIDENQPVMVIAAIAEAEGHSLSAEALEAEMSGSSPGIEAWPSLLDAGSATVLMACVARGSPATPNGNVNGTCDPQQQRGSRPHHR